MGIRVAEGQAQQTVSRARGEAQAIINRANAEARSLQEIARAVAASGEDPTSYLLAVKYIDVFGKILLYQNTSVEFLPTEAAFLLTSKGLGLSTIAGNRAKQLDIWRSYNVHTGKDYDC